MQHKSLLSACLPDTDTLRYWSHVGACPGPSTCCAMWLLWQLHKPERTSKYSQYTNMVSRHFQRLREEFVVPVVI